MRIVFMGTPGSAAATLETLLGGPDEVVGVVTQPDRPAGRGQATLPSPVRRTAAAAGIPVLTPRKMKDPGLLEELRRWRPDLVAVVAYGRILPQAILDLPPLGCVNVHYSLLPRYRGAAPMQWAILEGEAVTGVTTMSLVAEMDAGPIFLSEEVAMAPDETAATLEARLVPVGARLLTATLEGVGRGYLEPRPQDPAGVTFAPHAQERGRDDRLGTAGAGDRAADPGLHSLALGFHPLGRQAGQGARRESGGGGCRPARDRSARNGGAGGHGRDFGPPPATARCSSPSCRWKAASACPRPLSSGAPGSGRDAVRTPPSLV